jgi:Reverse transcriptase (RNA-dependent DNA polymerase)
VLVVKFAGNVNAISLVCLTLPSDRIDLCIHRPNSHLFFRSKLTERVVKNRLTGFLSANNLFNTFHSAFTKFHSIETALLTVRDYIIRAASQRVICLCLYHSAASDSTDHSILTERLSSCLISQFSLSWPKFCLTSRSFYVQIKDYQSSFTVSVRFRSAPSLFILFTSSQLPLVLFSLNLLAIITYILMTFSSSFLFLPKSCQIFQFLKRLLCRSWMSTHVLILIPFKTDFKLTSLSKQLSQLTSRVSLSIMMYLYLLLIQLVTWLFNLQCNS